MLFVQSLNTYYEKQERSSEYARLRNGDMFRKIDVSKLRECEVSAQIISLRYKKDHGVSPAQPYYEKYRLWSRSCFLCFAYLFFCQRLRKDPARRAGRNSFYRQRRPGTTGRKCSFADQRGNLPSLSAPDGSCGDL